MHGLYNAAPHGCKASAGTQGKDAPRRMDIGILAVHRCGRHGLAKSTNATLRLQDTTTDRCLRFRQSK